MDSELLVHFRLSESDFRAFQNLVGEHSIATAPPSLYNLTKSAPDPFSYCPLIHGKELPVH